MANGSTGERAGMCEGDVVVEVNGQNVEEEYFDEVVNLIKEGGTTLKLLVVEGQQYERLRNIRQTTSSGLFPQNFEVRHVNTQSICIFQIQFHF